MADILTKGSFTKQACDDILDLVQIRDTTRPALEPPRVKKLILWKRQKGKGKSSRAESLSVEAGGSSYFAVGRRCNKVKVGCCMFALSASNVSG